MGNHRHAGGCTPSGSVHTQTYSLLHLRYPCCTLPSIAFIVTAHLQTSPSLARRLHGRPEQPHSMRGEGQPPPCMEAHALKRCARANQQSTPHTFLVLHAASRCTHRAFTLTIEPLACMAAARAARVPPWRARRWTTIAMHENSRLQALCTCKSTVFNRTLPWLHLASRCTHDVCTLANEPLACMAVAPAARVPPWHARRWTTTAMHGGPRLQAL